MSSDQLRCKFGTLTPVTASRLSASVLQCLSPARNVTGSVAVEISNNNQDYTSNAVQYAYVTPISLLSRLPANGPVTGGTIVTVVGDHFLPSLKCQFAGLYAATTYVNATRVLCRAPSGTAGLVSLEVTNNNYDFTASGTQFLYQPSMVVSTLLPITGPTVGGTFVNMTGSNFVNPMWCKFGTMASVAAVYYSASSAGCTSPAVNNVSSVAVGVCKQQDFTSDQAMFSYYAALSVISHSPVSGPVSGGTQVKLNGLNFINLATLSCRFSSNVVSATWQSSRWLSRAGWNGWHCLCGD